jgi:hypothetical protein
MPPLEEEKSSTTCITFNIDASSLPVARLSKPHRVNKFGYLAFYCDVTNGTAYRLAIKGKAVERARNSRSERTHIMGRHHFPVLSRAQQRVGCSRSVRGHRIDA